MVLGNRLIRSREESAVVGLTKKLKKESEKRVGAERDAANWKKKCGNLGKIGISRTAEDLFYCDRCNIDFSVNSIKREGKQVFCPLCQHELLPRQKNWETLNAAP